MKTQSNIDIALLLIRVGLAIVFIVHGMNQLSGLVSYIEIVGGVSMILGFLTGWSGVALAAIMVGSAAGAQGVLGFVGNYEFDLMLFVSTIAISLAGPGSYRISRLWKKS
jgi:uncharacterized membrane protein YphA (DoxX/SURF4 family)